MVKLESERLYIRDLKMEDLDDHHRLISDPDVMHYIRDIQTHSLDESKDNLIFSIVESKKKERVYYFFGMYLKDTDEHIGSIGFTVLEKGDSGNVELGYFIHKEYWRKGYTYEASEVVVKYAFDLGFQKITTGCVYNNVNSESIMKKLGMYKESHLYKHTFIDGKWYDRVTYGLYNPKFLTKVENQRLTVAKLAEILQVIPYHFDASTSAFIYGVDFEMNDIDIVFLSHMENEVRQLFPGYIISNTEVLDDLKHFKIEFNDEIVHCLFYKDDSNFYKEESIKVIHHIPVKYKSIDYYKRHCKSQEMLEAIKKVSR